MKGVFRIWTVSGIGVFAHWTLAVFFAWLFGMTLWRGGSVPAAFAAVDPDRIRQIRMHQIDPAVDDRHHDS